MFLTLKPRKGFSLTKWHCLHSIKHEYNLVKISKLCMKLDFFFFTPVVTRHAVNVSGMHKKSREVDKSLTS